MRRPAIAKSVANKCNIEANPTQTFFLPLVLAVRQLDLEMIASESHQRIITALEFVGFHTQLFGPSRAKHTINLLKLLEWRSGTVLDLKSSARSLAARFKAVIGAISFAFLP